MEAENAMKFLSNIDGSQLDFTITRQMEESMKVKDTEYEMSSEFFIEIRNQEKTQAGYFLVDIPFMGILSSIM